jgi:hypothetical protein
MNVAAQRQLRPRVGVDLKPARAERFHVYTPEGGLGYFPAGTYISVDQLSILSSEEAKPEDRARGSRVPTISPMWLLAGFSSGARNIESHEGCFPACSPNLFSPNASSDNVDAPSSGYQVIIGVPTDTVTGIVFHSFIAGVAPLAEGFSKFRELIVSFQHLREGWDSYNAKAPAKQAVLKALRFLDRLKEECCLPDAVIPTSDASILIRYVYEERTFRWEFYSDGEVAYSRDTSGAHREYFDVTDEKLELPLYSF